MDEATVLNKDDQLIDLPPGFRFHPTDEEIITYYLTHKVMNNNFNACAIGEVNLNNCEPWDLPKKAKMGEKEYYFFCQKDPKYPTGMRTNRATESGYWKATGKDKEIYRGKSSVIGRKKTLVFYHGRAPKGEKSNWVMHEYRLEGKFSSKPTKNEWVVCRVLHKNSGVKTSLMSMKSFTTDLLDSSSLPPLMYLPYSNKPDSNFTDGEYEFNPSFNADYISYNPTTVNPSSYQMNNPTSNSKLYSQFQTQNHTYCFQSHANPSDLHQERPGLIPNFASNRLGFADQAVLRALGANNEAIGGGTDCKLEQLSTNSLVSTSLENIEISSVVSKHDIRSNKLYEDRYQSPSIGIIEDLDLWDY